MAKSLLAKCDGCLRIGRPSAAADLMVETARALGKRVWFSVGGIGTD